MSAVDERREREMEAARARLAETADAISWAGRVLAECRGSLAGSDGDTSRLYRLALASTAAALGIGRMELALDTAIREANAAEHLARLHLERES